MKIIAIEMDNGDPGYFTLGHEVKAEEFVAQVNAEYGEQFTADLVERRWFRDEEWNGEEVVRYKCAVWKSTEGAYPVTFVSP